MKIFLQKHTRALSLISAACAGYGLAVPNIFVGVAALVLALLLDLAYFKLTPTT